MTAASSTSISESGPKLSRRQAGVLAGTVLIIAGCGMVYELSIAAVSSYLLGNSIYQFSITIGLFMAAMGAGAYASKLITTRALEWFLAAEIGLALVGGLSSIALFAAFPAKGLYAPTMYTFIAIIGGLVGLEIPILVRFLSEHGGIRRGVAEALSLDYLGALVGCLAFPLLMLPHLGLLRASFAAGLLNAMVALICTIVFRNRLRHAMVWIVVSLVAASVLATGYAVDDRLTRFAEDGLYGGRILLREQTPYQRVVLTVDAITGEHRLYLDGHVQFAEFDEYRYHEALVHPVMGLQGPREQVLILGGGDGLAAREVLQFSDVQHITIVDLDPAVTTLAAEFPPLVKLNAASLADSRVDVVNRDAFAFVRETEAKFDRIIVDLPDPHNEALAKLYSVEFYRMARRRMHPGSALVVQSSSPFVTPEVYGAIAQTLEAAGFTVVSYHVHVPAFGPWGFHLAMAEQAEPTFNWLPGARFMSAKTFEAAQVFGRDMTPMRPGVNSMFSPKLYGWYQEGVKRGRPKD